MESSKLVHNTALSSYIQVWVKENFFVSGPAVHASLRLIFYTLLGSILIYPVVSKLPLVGWDWFFFFNANNPSFNLYTKNSAYPPYARYIIQLLTWMDWRSSLAFLNAITIMTISLATWKNGGRYKEIALALTTPPLWLLMWIGHPDGLVLLGLMTGLVPLIWMKPILSVFGILSQRKLFSWSALFLILSMVIWPLWFLSMRNATIGHETAMGWADLGWPLLLLGLLLIIGAGSDPYRLMAAGCFLTPYLMPYHMAILTPAIGKTRGWRQILIWISAWLVLIGAGSSKMGHLISFLFPLAVYFMCGSFSRYKENLRANLEELQSLFFKIRQLRGFLAIVLAALVISGFIFAKGLLTPVSTVLASPSDEMIHSVPTESQHSSPDLTWQHLAYHNLPPPRRGFSLAMNSIND